MLITFIVYQAVRIVKGGYLQLIHNHIVYTAIMVFKCAILIPEQDQAVLY